MIIDPSYSLNDLPREIIWNILLYDNVPIDELRVCEEVCTLFQKIIREGWALLAKHMCILPYVKDTSNKVALFRSFRFFNEAARTYFPELGDLFPELEKIHSATHPFLLRNEISRCLKSYDRVSRSLASDPEAQNRLRSHPIFNDIHRKINRTETQQADWVAQLLSGKKELDLIETYSVFSFGGFTKCTAEEFGIYAGTMYHYNFNSIVTFLLDGFLIPTADQVCNYFKFNHDLRKSGYDPRYEELFESFFNGLEKGSLSLPPVLCRLLDNMSPYEFANFIKKIDIDLLRYNTAFLRDKYPSHYTFLFITREHFERGLTILKNHIIAFKTKEPVLNNITIISQKESAAEKKYYESLRTKFHSLSQKWSQQNQKTKDLHGRFWCLLKQELKKEMENDSDVYDLTHISLCIKAYIDKGFKIDENLIYYVIRYLITLDEKYRDLSDWVVAKLLEFIDTPSLDFALLLVHDWVRYVIEDIDEVSYALKTLIGKMDKASFDAFWEQLTPKFFSYAIFKKWGACGLQTVAPLTRCIDSIFDPCYAVYAYELAEVVATRFENNYIQFCDS